MASYDYDYGQPPIERPRSQTPSRRVTQRSGVSPLVVGLAVLVVVAMVAGAGGFLLLSRSARAADLNASLAAYLDGDCRSSVSKFESGTRSVLLLGAATTSSQQRAAVAECRTVLKIAGADAEKLTAYADLAKKLGDSPARASIRREVAATAKQSATLAKTPTAATCSAVLTLRFYDLLPKAEPTLPALFVACGRLLMSTKSDAAQVNALQLFRTVRTGYPKSPYTKTAIAAEAKLRITRIATSGIVYDPYEPRRSSNAGNISTFVIHNDSPATIFVAITGGNQARVVEVPPCRTCGLQPRDYSCKTTTPHVDVALPKGRYKVSWDFIQPGSQSTPSMALVDLTAGGTYQDCNYLFPGK